MRPAIIELIQLRTEGTWDCWADRRLKMPKISIFVQAFQVRTLEDSLVATLGKERSPNKHLSGKVRITAM